MVLSTFPNGDYALLVRHQCQEFARPGSPWRLCRFCPSLSLLELCRLSRSQLLALAAMRLRAINMVLCLRTSTTAVMVGCERPR